MIDTIHVAITMDCEPPKDIGIENASGPVSWEESELSIRGYDGIAREFGFPVTYFQHPEVALHHAPLMLELEAGGACIDGLHLHPWKFDNERYNAHFGGLSARDQYAIISEASALFRHGLGRRPRYFRPGTFSANDDTFRVLVELGFVGGSVSAPERNFVELNSVWNGAPKDPHRPHPDFRHCVGELPFANIPLSSDFSSEGQLNGRPYYRDLRPDYEDSPQGFRQIVRNIIHQISDRAPALPVLNLVTHNDHPYSDPSNAVTENYVAVLDEISGCCAKLGIRAAGAEFHALSSVLLNMGPSELGFVHA